MIKPDERESKFFELLRDKAARVVCSSNDMDELLGKMSRSHAHKTEYWKGAVDMFDVLSQEEVDEDEDTDESI